MSTTAILLTCIKVCLCRVLDVSMGTVRTILTVQGKSNSAALVGFIEIFVWFTVARDALSSDAPAIAVGIAYAGGFALGTFVGCKLSAKFIKGHVMVQAVTSRRDPAMVKAVRDAGFGITVLEVSGTDYAGEKYMIMADMDKNLLSSYEALLHQLDENVFIVVSETKSYQGGYQSGAK